MRVTIFFMGGVLFSKVRAAIYIFTNAPENPADSCPGISAVHEVRSQSRPPHILPTQALACRSAVTGGSPGNVRSYDARAGNLFGAA